MTTKTTCKHCLKPMEICRQQDDLLIRPLRPDVTEVMDYIDPYNLWRVSKAHDRVLGLYCKDKDVYYFEHTDIPVREWYDTRISLPLCVWEGDLEGRNIAIGVIETINLDDLPVEKEYQTMLKELLYEYNKTVHNFY